MLYQKGLCTACSLFILAISCWTGHGLTFIVPLSRRASWSICNPPFRRWTASPANQIKACVFYLQTQTCQSYGHFQFNSFLGESVNDDTFPSVVLAVLHSFNMLHFTWTQAADVEELFLMDVCSWPLQKL